MAEDTKVYLPHRVARIGKAGYRGDPSQVVVMDTNNKKVTGTVKPNITKRPKKGAED